jgi:RHS repeat-associated protein
MPSTTLRLRLLYFIVALLAICFPSHSQGADAIIHNKDGCYQCEESWARVTVVINYSNLLVGYNTVIVSSNGQGILTFQPATPSGTIVMHQVDAHTSAAHTYGVPYTMYYYTAASAAQIVGNTSQNVPASGGRNIIGLAVNDNGLPSCTCPYTDTQNDVTLVYTVGTAPSPTPGPSSSPTPGGKTTCDAPKVGGDQQVCASCAGVQSAASAAAAFGMARYSVHAMLISLNVQDTPLRYSPPYGPAIDFTVTYNEKETQQPSTFSYSNLGPKWTFGWLSYVSDDPNSQLALTGLYRSGGGAEVFAFDSSSQSFVPDPRSQAVLVKTGTATYERRLPDGSKEVFALSDGAASYPRRIFMTHWVDAAGNSASIGYDTNFRVTTITDALGQVTNVYYELSADPLKVTKVIDPFGRFATFEYTNGLLTKITDEIGIQSQFTYASGTDSIASLTTPYGTTTFARGGSGTNQWIEMTDPPGGKERVEYRDQAPGISSSDPHAPNATGIVNADLDSANTFYWNKKAMSVAPGDYTQAKITHWLYNADGTLSDIISSEKQPLEKRVWHTYAGQPDYRHVGPTASPSQIARLLADGSTQLSQFEYNSIGKMTKVTDPVGRVMTYVYDTNNIDLLEVRQTRGANNQLLRKFTYNGLHEPLTDTDAAGQSTTYTYNGGGQVLTRANAQSETTTYGYGGAVPSGCLASITSPAFNSVSAVTTFTYDAFNRLHTVTDSENYTVTTDYDNLDRKTKVTYPDTTYEQFQYTDNLTGAMTLDLTGSRDRRGLWTYRHYNANQKMDSLTDPANRTTQYGYCTCGALTTITDPNNHTTTFYRDIESRVYQKVFQDGTTIDYLYEGQSAANTAGATSRLKSSTDAKSQRTNYTYFADDNIQQITYTNAAGQAPTPPTPGVSYTYDVNYNRVSTMVDGTGTTTYSYNTIAVPPALGAGQLASIDAPLTNDTITFSYDQLGRIISRSVNGTANSETWTFDSLGRVSTDASNLGTFTNTYVGVTNRLSQLVYPGGASANYAYFSNTQDKRLQQILHLNSTSASTSQFDYTYDAQGEITTWTQNNSGLSGPQRFDLGYDNADQLTTAPFKDASTNALIRQYSYGYDYASNRTSETVASTTTTSTPNNVNEITSQSGGANRILTFDLNGNITSDGGTRTFEWDAANRLVAINYASTGDRTEITYDGLGRRVRIVEKSAGTSFVVQPPNNQYASYSSSSFFVAAGTYTLKLTGLNPNGGDNTAFVDSVSLNGSLVPNGGFETPNLGTGGYAYAPSGGTWTFEAGTGISNNGSGFTSGNPNAPEGAQVGIIQRSYSMSQSVTLAAGSYTLSLRAAQRGNYNASFQQVAVTLQTAVPIISTKNFVWLGQEMVEERDGSNTVVKRFYANGEEINGSAYFDTRDHLGSIREMFTGGGTVVARYDYDPYGRSTTVLETTPTDFNFTGLYRHSKSNLDLAVYRAYDPDLGRWLSRDPIAETGGLNLYAYVKNSSLVAIDPSGLLDVHYWAPSQGGSKGGWYGHVSITLNNGTYISYWPSQPIAPPFEHTPARAPNYALDRTEEGDRDPVNVHIDGLDESAIERWWNGGQGHGDFSTFNNCSTTVSEALRQGGLPIPRRPVYQPDQVMLDLKVLLPLRGPNSGH